MNRKLFFAIVAALLVMLAAAALLMRSEQSAWKSADSRAGQKLVPALKLENVARIAIQDAQATATLVRRDASWVLQERADFPADADRVRDLLVKLGELKIVQTETAGPGQLGRLRLVEPGGKGGNGTEEVGTRVELKDGGGALLAHVLLGKKVAARLAGAAPGPEQGAATGRYAMSGGDAGVMLVSDPLAQAEAKPQAWLAKDLVRIDRVKSIAATAPDGRQRFMLSRDSEAGDWKLAGGAKPDLQRATDVVSALYAVQLVDVVTDPAKTAIEHPITIKAQTFDDLSYTLRIDDKAVDGNERIAVSATGEPPAARIPAKGESAEEKAKQDKSFAERRAGLVDKLRRDRTLERWTYLVAKPGIDALLRDRTQLLPEKKAARKP